MDLLNIHKSCPCSWRAPSRGWPPCPASEEQGKPGHRSLCSGVSFPCPPAPPSSRSQIPGQATQGDFGRSPASKHASRFKMPQPVIRAFSSSHLLFSSIFPFRYYKNKIEDPCLIIKQHPACGLCTAASFPCRHFNQLRVQSASESLSLSTQGTIINRKIVSNDFPLPLGMRISWCLNGLLHYITLSINANCRQ